MVHCLLCGTPYLETDAYCPGEQCGTDLHGQRMGDPECAVQAWCEPRRSTAAPGETVMVTLTLRNAGSAPDRYDDELPRDAGRRIGLDRPGPPDVYPGETRVWTIVYTVPPDIADQVPPSGLFGLGEVGAGSGGSAFEEASRVVEESDVPIRVVSARDMRVAACAPFSIRVVSTDLDDAGGRAGGVPANPYPDDRQRRDGKRRSRVVAAVLATVAAIVVAVLVGMAMAGSDGTRPAARSVATGAGPSATETRSAAVPTTEAPVTSTPDPSDSASPSTSTSAPGKLTVPNVVGMTEAQGVALLREKGFRGTVRGGGGTIASTDPAAGRKVDRDKAEIVVVMSGVRTTPPVTRPSTSPPPTDPGSPSPTATTTVPPLAGLTVADAGTALRNARLNIALPSGASRNDVVSGSDPNSGDVVPVGTTVTVSVTAPTTGAGRN
ncbi:PASTA domain-containing protein [Embleya scabrispora]|uniref:PASTA domain-containing protein n=1 Tax=Embleya scabrispora TaxID=159449 RepID=UPI0003AA13BF|nr:PASTA domain-containing protein [Embleya scabrispora]MYS85842.1 PASTA domain-containing protein [Streptomyces sp. SID5474]